MASKRDAIPARGMSHTMKTTGFPRNDKPYPPAAARGGRYPHRPHGSRL